MQEVVELRLVGRLDASWAGFVLTAIEDEVRGGHHHIELDMALVDYLSSAGIRVVVKFFRQLQGIRGSLRITNASASAAKILQMAGLSAMLGKAAKPASQGAHEQPALVVRQGRLNLHMHPLAASAPMVVTVMGDPRRVANGASVSGDSRRMLFDAGAWGVGIGAFGNDFEDCADRFGEFLALGGAAATMPTDGSSVPDFVLATADLVPSVEALQAIVGVGDFTTMFRFEAAEAGVIVGLGEVLDAVFASGTVETAAIALFAEASSLVGATLLQSPARLAGSPLFLFPALRERMTFTTERGMERSTVLITGIASRAPSAVLLPHVRPLGIGSSLLVHLHALSFPYRPLPLGAIRLPETVAQLLDGSLATALLHLMSDDRPYEGIGQTELLRGACFFAPVVTVKEQLS